MSPNSFLAGIKAGALASWQKGVLPSVTAAQAAIESGWGTSGLSSAPNNNLFGIKGSYNGSYVMYSTREWSAYRGNYYITAAFRRYPTWSASVLDHAHFFTDNGRYHNLLWQRDYATFARLVQADGYATDPNYANTVISIVREYGLAAWDRAAQAGISATPSKPWPHKAIDLSKCQIKYVPGYAIAVWTKSGRYTGKKLKNGTWWKVSGRATIKGVPMLCVGGNQYVPIRYTNLDDRTITINFTAGYGVNVLNAKGVWTGRRLKTGTSWQAHGLKTVAGKTCYDVGNAQYIPQRYTQFGPGKP